MAWFRRRTKESEATPAARPAEPEEGVEPQDAPAPEAALEELERVEEETDTVGNPIVQRVRSDARHAAPDAGPTRAELRMLQFVAEGRIARTATGGAAAAFWRIDGAFAVGSKAMMLDWLADEGYLDLGPRQRVACLAVLTDRGRGVLDGRA